MMFANTTANAHSFSTHRYSLNNNNGFLRTKVIKRTITKTQHHNHNHKKIGSRTTTSAVKTTTKETIIIPQQQQLQQSSRKNLLTITKSTSSSGASPFGDDSSVFSKGQTVATNALATFKTGVNSRLEADKNFVFKLLAEICIDELITLSVLIWVTGFSAEAWTPTIRLAALVQMLSAALNDTLIVYFLAPTSQSKSNAEKPKMAHVFQEGNYSTAERIMCYFAKAKFYLMIGATTCTLATFFAKAIGGNLAGFFPGILIQSIMLGGIHMSLSANTRYQIVNGIERVIYERFPKVAKVGSVIIRTSNNFLGARLWIALSKLLSS